MIDVFGVFGKKKSCPSGSCGGYVLCFGVFCCLFFVFFGGFINFFFFFLFCWCLLGCFVFILLLFCGQFCGVVWGLVLFCVWGGVKKKNHGPR